MTNLECVGLASQNRSVSNIIKMKASESEWSNQKQED